MLFTKDDASWTECSENDENITEKTLFNDIKAGLSEAIEYEKGNIGARTTTITKKTKEKLFNPCYEHCYLKYGKEYSTECDYKCEYAKAVAWNEEFNEERNIPVHNLQELALRFCALIGCKSCPVNIYDYEKRTKYEKECLHEPCFSNLYKWILEQAEM